MFERTLALFLLLLMSPLMGLITLPLFLSNGPIIFSQMRLGKRRVPFTLYKFRSMRVGSDWRIATNNDERITRYGKFLRTSHLDELPQLWNIIKGDMSFFGPRPEQQVYVDRFILQYGNDYLRRFKHKPGLLGLSQVLFGYGHTNMKARMFFDSVSLEPQHRLRLLGEFGRYILKGARFS